MFLQHRKKPSKLSAAILMPQHRLIASALKLAAVRPLLQQICNIKATLSSPSASCMTANSFTQHDTGFEIWQSNFHQIETQVGWYARSRSPAQRP